MLRKAHHVSATAASRSNGAAFKSSSSSSSPSLFFFSWGPWMVRGVLLLHLVLLAGALIYVLHSSSSSSSSSSTPTSNNHHTEDSSSSSSSSAALSAGHNPWCLLRQFQQQQQQPSGPGSSSKAPLLLSGQDKEPPLTTLAQEDEAAAADPTGVSTHFFPLTGIIRSFYNTTTQNPQQRRQCITLTAVPSEISDVLKLTQALLDRYPAPPPPPPDTATAENQNDSEAHVYVHAVHLNIPFLASRFEAEKYPTTAQIWAQIPAPYHDRIIVHRLWDHGPLTRYLGPVSWERHPDTSVVLFDIDNQDTMLYRDDRNLQLLFLAARQFDPAAMWCFMGENFVWDITTNISEPAWDTYPLIKEATGAWNQVHMCRGANGVLFHPAQHFQQFWFNQTDYHESCFWDDDRWVAFQLHRQGFVLKSVKEIHRPLPPPEEKEAPVKSASLVVAPIPEARQEKSSSSSSSRRERRLGTLTTVNNQLHSAQTCTTAWMVRHPEAFANARQTKKKDE